VPNAELKADSKCWFHYVFPEEMAWCNISVVIGHPMALNYNLRMWDPDKLNFLTTFRPLSRTLWW
jgi:hypothetical protein